MYGVHVDRGTEPMLGWGQRIATRTGVESPSEDTLWKIKFNVCGITIIHQNLV